MEDKIPWTFVTSIYCKGDTLAFMQVTIDSGIDYLFSETYTKGSEDYAKLMSDFFTTVIESGEKVTLIISDNRLIDELPLKTFPWERVIIQPPVHDESSLLFPEWYSYSNNFDFYEKMAWNQIIRYVQLN